MPLSAIYSYFVAVSCTGGAHRNTKRKPLPVASH